MVYIIFKIELRLFSGVTKSLPANEFKCSYLAQKYFGLVRILGADLFHQEFQID
jgi:hypothetical protein